MRNEFLFLSIVVFVFVSGVAIGIYFGVPTAKFNQINDETPFNNTFKEKTLEDYKIFSQSQIKLLAVDQEGNGVVTNLTVRAVPGKGSVLVDVKSLLFWIDTQQSIQTSREVAEKYMGKISKNVDLTYTIDIPNGSAVGGPSAGAAFTIATIAALENKTLRNDTVITGTIESDGSIGKVGGVLEKGKAAEKAGYKRFLVPKGESEYVEYKKEEKCSSHGSLRICNIEYKPVKINVGKEIGMDVIEVSNIEEAAKYFLM
ncbi:MAG: hypothetical protein J7L08_00305 [Candidatus Aenigmarchaeota archaeon]|nr:hypothetical protein [Candidatus Aenigmarchaeota archaeon]